MTDLEVRPISRKECDSHVNSGDVQRLVVALISMAIYGDDRDYARTFASNHLRHEDPDVVSAAILSVGHCARLDGVCDVPQIREMFRLLARDEQYVGRIEDAVDDIVTFTGISRDEILQR